MARALQWHLVTMHPTTARLVRIIIATFAAGVPVAFSIALTIA